MLSDLSLFNLVAVELASIGIVNPTILPELVAITMPLFHPVTAETLSSKSSKKEMTLMKKTY